MSRVPTICMASTHKKKTMVTKQKKKKQEYRNTKKKPVKIEIKLIGNFVFSASIGKI